jgi:hypothetical protein
LTIPRRIETVLASGLTSSYKKKYKPKERWPTDVFKKGAYVAPDMFDALVKLDHLVKFNKGNLYITDLYRSWEDQEQARKAFETGKKKAFVAKPGSSFHNAGRAVDISIKELNFEGMDRDLWLSNLWNIAQPLGFRPIIKLPDMDASEAWHFDYPGEEWIDVYDKLSYPEAAKCAILDIGGWNPKTGKIKLKKMFCQAQLIRLGYYEIGKVDGVFGPKTNKVLEYEGVFDLDLTTMAKVLSKRDS